MNLKNLFKQEGMQNFDKQYGHVVLCLSLDVLALCMGTHCVTVCPWLENILEIINSSYSFSIISNYNVESY